MPVLNVLKMSGATDLVVVVTRYFGGILLGAGGLVRAYSASARQALDEAGIAVYEEFAIVRVKVSYSDYQKLTVALPKWNISEEGAEFGEEVAVMAALEADRVDELSSLVVEMTNGKGSVDVIAHEERPSLRHAE